MTQKEQTTSPIAIARVTTGFTTTIRARSHRLTADEPEQLGGDDVGPTPVELLAASLASCTAITAQMYARRKEWPVQSIEVECVAQSDGHAGPIPAFAMTITLEGDLTDEQRKRIFEIAGRCPVHRTLHDGASVEMQLAD